MQYARKGQVDSRKCMEYIMHKLLNSSLKSIILIGFKVLLSTRKKGKLKNERICM